MCFVVQAECANQRCQRKHDSLSQRPCHITEEGAEDCGSYTLDPIPENQYNRYYGALCKRCRDERLIDEEYLGAADLRSVMRRGAVIASELREQLQNEHRQSGAESYADIWPDCGPPRPWAFFDTPPAMWTYWNETPREPEIEWMRWRYERTRNHFLMLIDPLPYEFLQTYLNRQMFAVCSSGRVDELKDRWKKFFQQFNHLRPYLMTRMDVMPQEETKQSWRSLADQNEERYLRKLPNRQARGSGSVEPNGWTPQAVGALEFLDRQREDEPAVWHYWRATSPSPAPDNADAEKHRHDRAQREFQHFSVPIPYELPQEYLERRRRHSDYVRNDNSLLAEYWRFFETPSNLRLRPVTYDALP